MEYMQHICIMCTCGTKHYHYQQIYMYNVRLLLFPTLHYNNTPLRIWSTLEHSMDSNFSIHLGQSWKTAYDSYAIMPNRARFYSLELSSPSRAIIHPWNALNYTACTQRTFICDCTFLSVLPQTRIMYGIYNQIKYARLYRFRWIELIVVSNLGKVACTEWTEFGLCLRISTDSIRFFPFKCKMLEEKKCLCVRARICVLNSALRLSSKSAFILVYIFFVDGFVGYVRSSDQAKDGEKVFCFVSVRSRWENIKIKSVLFLLLLILYLLYIGCSF